MQSFDNLKVIHAFGRTVPRYPSHGDPAGIRPSRTRCGVPVIGMAAAGFTG